MQVATSRGARDKGILARTLAADCIVPFDHVVKDSQVQFFSRYLRVVAASRCSVLNDSPNYAVRDDDLVTRRGPTPVAVFDPGLVIAKIAFDERANVVRGP